MIMINKYLTYDVHDRCFDLKTGFFARYIIYEKFFLTYVENLDRQVLFAVYLNLSTIKIRCFSF